MANEDKKARDNVQTNKTCESTLCHEGRPVDQCDTQSCGMERDTGTQRLWTRHTLEEIPPRYRALIKGKKITSADYCDL